MKRETNWSKDSLAYHPASGTVYKLTDNGVEYVGDAFDLSDAEWQEIVDNMCEYVSNQ